MSNELTPDQINKIIEVFSKIIPDFPNIEGRTYNYDYDKEFRLFYIGWQKDYFGSEDHGDIILDFNKDHTIIGVECLDLDLDNLDKIVYINY